MHHCRHISQLLGYAGRPALTTVANDTASRSPGLLLYAPPIQTAPCDLLIASATAAAAAGAADGHPTAAAAAAVAGAAALPVWNEVVELDMPPGLLAAEDALLLAEVVHLPASINEALAAGGGSAGAAAGGCAGRRVAWGFLRLRALGVAALAAATPRRMEVQLYRYCADAAAAPGPFPDTPAKEAFLSWRTLMCSNSNSNSSSSNMGSGSSGGWGGSGSGSGGDNRDSGWLAAFQRDAMPLVAPQSPLAAALAAARAARSRYPSMLVLSLAATPRPSPSIVVTDPAAGVRPLLPAGYGSGFEVGREHLQLSTQQRSGLERLLDAGSAGTSSLLWPSGVQTSPAAVELERALHRPFTAPCEVPNVSLETVAGTAGGAACASFSHDGRWLAVACGSADGEFKVRGSCTGLDRKRVGQIQRKRELDWLTQADNKLVSSMCRMPHTQIAVHHGLTGQLQCVLGSHTGLVYDVTWAPDDSAVVTASADLTAVVWPLPPRSSPFGPLQTTSTSSLPTSDKDPRLVAVTLQHDSFVYAAAFCPQPGIGGAVVVTGAYDGMVRLWDAHPGGRVAPLLCVARVPGNARVNALAFDAFGSRLYVGDSNGRVHEFAVAGSQTGSCQSGDQVKLGSSSLQAAWTLDWLRASGELAAGSGGAVHLALHPAGRHIISVMKSGDVAAVDLKVLLVARQFGRIKARSGIVKATISPGRREYHCGMRPNRATYATCLFCDCDHALLNAQNNCRWELRRMRLRRGLRHHLAVRLRRSCTLALPGGKRCPHRWTFVERRFSGGRRMLADSVRADRPGVL